MNRFIPLTILICSLLCLPLDTSASEKDNGKIKTKTSNAGVLFDPFSSIISINNITSWVRNDGFHDWIIDYAWNGSFPKGNNAGTIFSEGMVWGGIVFDGTTPAVRVNGNTYSTGCEPVNRLYRVRADYKTADLTDDAANFFNIPISQVTLNDIQQIYDQYENDWNEWPAYDGAPFTDVNADGYYDSQTDIPGVPASSQTIYITYNDSYSPSLYGSPVIGLKITETYWVFSNISDLENVIFKKIDLIYSGGSTPVPGAYINDMYLCQWSDPDVGVAWNDFAGCDTSLNLGYSYNGLPVDSVYLNIGMEPPAAGYIMLQGVSDFTGSPNDSAIFNFKWRKGYRYVNPKPMSSFIYFASNGSWSDPAFDYTGTLEFYNMMRGYLPDPPYPNSFPFPATVADYTENGCYLLNGDPVAGTGKLDGVVDLAGDRRILLINGPFNVNLGDTAQIVLAFLSASGNDYLSAITELKRIGRNTAASFNSWVSSGIPNDVTEDRITVSHFYLYQNYPNPFNPATTIRFENDKPCLVSLKIYDILGRETAVLINTETPAGIHSVEWNASGFASGVYYCQYRAENFVSTKKLILLK